MWQVFVLAAVRLGANLTYDHLQYLAGNDRNLRAMMQVGDWTQESFNWRRIRDNICLVQVETIEKINQLVVEEGHRLHPEAVEYVRGDTFVAETNIHYPTESGLMLDGLIKICDLAPQLAQMIGSDGWRQSKSLLKKAKRAARAIGRIKTGRNYKKRLQQAYEGLFQYVNLLLPRLEILLEEALGNLPYDARRPAARRRSVPVVPAIDLLAQRHRAGSRHRVSPRGAGRKGSQRGQTVQSVRTGHGTDHAWQGRFSDRVRPQGDGCGRRGGFHLSLESVADRNG